MDAEVLVFEFASSLQIQQLVSSTNGSNILLWCFASFRNKYHHFSLFTVCVVPRAGVRWRRHLGYFVLLLKSIFTY